MPEEISPASLSVKTEMGLTNWGKQRRGEIKALTEAKVSGKEEMVCAQVRELLKVSLKYKAEQSPAL